MGRPRGLKRKGEKRVFSFLSTVQRVNIQHKQEVHCFEWCQPRASVTSVFTHGGMENREEHGELELGSCVLGEAADTFAQV